MMWLFYHLIFPLTILAAKAFHLHQEKIETALLKINNSLQKKNKRKVNKILILVPHCLQHKICKQNVIENARECKRCGKCKIKDVVALSEKYSVQLAVATGGRLAKEIVIKSNADMVLAVACEKELMAGIIDVYPARVWALINKRPFGPCVNTDVDCEEVAAALWEVMKKSDVSA